MNLVRIRFAITFLLVLGVHALPALGDGAKGEITTLFGTYLGGTQTFSFEGASDVAVDNIGNAYVVGSTNAFNFPATPGSFTGGPGGGTDVFLAKFNSIGVLMYAAKFGGSAADNARSVDVDVQGNVYIAGDTLSSDFPVINGLQENFAGIQDGFLMVFDGDDGSPLFSDYLGGSMADEILGISATSRSNVCVCGRTTSADFLTVNAEITVKPSDVVRDAFVTCMDVVEQVTQFSTYLGGGAGASEARAITHDNQGRTVVVGTTEASNFPNIIGGIQNNFPTANGFSSGFITRFLSNGILSYATFLGGAGGDTTLNAVITDTVDRMIVGGDTWAVGFPTVPFTGQPNVSPAAIVSILEINGASLVLSDRFNLSSGIGFPATVNDLAIQPGQPLLAVGDVSFAPDGSWFYKLYGDFGAANTVSVFLNSTGLTTGKGAAMDSVGNLYVAGQVAGTGLAGRVVNATQPILANNVDAYVFKESNLILSSGGEGEGGICPPGCFDNGETGECVCPEGEGSVDCAIPNGLTNFAALNMNGPNIGEPSTFNGEANGFFVFEDGEAAIALNIVFDAAGTVTAQLYDGPPNAIGTNVVLSFPTLVTCGAATAALAMPIDTACRLVAGDIWLGIVSTGGVEIGARMLVGTSTATCLGIGDGEGETEGETGDPCSVLCPGNGVDMDGDGLDVACETCLGSSDLDPDNDNDGMPDNFELANGLDPANPADALTDKDGDGINNLQEYLIGSDPCDESSPGANRFVSPDGVDDVLGGSAVNPWRTLTFALNQINNLGITSARIRVSPGVYTEDVSLLPGVTLTGAGCSLDDPNFNLDDCAVIQGEITGANGATIENLVVQEANPGSVLLQMDNVAMRVLGVIFIGNSGRTATGIRATGSSVSAALIDQCGFSGLGTGIDVLDSIPVIRRSLFRGHSDTYIRFRSTAVKQASTNGLGTRSNPNSGFNRFAAPDQGELQSGAIVNERAETISMEGNEWGSNDTSTIDALIAGPADFEPFLAIGGALLAGSVFVTVWDAETQQPILDAAVNLQISPFGPVTDNENGVYPFVAVEEGQYLVTVNADDFPPATQNIDVDAGEIVSVIIPVGAVVVPPGCGCNPMRTDDDAIGGDMIVAALLLAALLIAWRRSQLHTGT